MKKPVPRPNPEQSVEKVAFKTRARTIDHLGRGQIADGPTAVSELWKNAWDAYAAQVSLNIFDGDPIVAAVFDDGFGMSDVDFVERWLVIGTESKVDGPPPPPPPWFKGPARQRQGEKGIGRLSAAFLAPATLVLSQQAGGSISAVLVDWRLFENPYLSLDEISLPVRTFADRGAILAGLADMVEVVLDNIGPKAKDGTRAPSDAWQRFARDEIGDGRSSTLAAITKFWEQLPIEQRHLDEWPVYAGLAEHGTALYLLGVHYDLSVWVNAPHEDDEAQEVKVQLRDILTGFTDTLSDEPVEFEYEVLVYRKDVPKRILSSSDVFDLSEFRELEHTVEGSFDDDGIFRGTIRAFGKDLGEKVIPPQRRLRSARSERPGPFKFCIGTFEQVALNSTHTSRRHTDLLKSVEQYGGVRVYRDGLRVMPYGAVSADFFALEETRQKHAGRYFWAHRRSFGRLAFTREANPYLRDKAGREGLVENNASRELRLLVQHVLLELAKQYFGTDAPDRPERIAEAKERNLRGKKAADDARKRRRAEFGEYLTRAIVAMPLLAERAKSISSRIDGMGDDVGRDDLALLRADIEQARAELVDLAPTNVPGTLGAAEDRYRAFRDDFDEASDLVRLSDEELRRREAVSGTSTPAQVVRAARERHRQALDHIIDQYRDRIRDNIKIATQEWTKNVDDDHKRYERDTAPFMRSISEKTNVVDVLTLLETTRREFEAELAERYRPMIRNITAALEGIDAETALATVDEDREQLDRRVRDLNAVAQLGITVEIIAHELEMLDGEVTRNLEKLPAQAKSSKSYRDALNAHQALTEKLRFLAPLQLAGARIREPITGTRIEDYLVEFFGDTFNADNIEFAATDAFRAIEFTDLPSRILPVFVNLVNNAIYWVGRSSERQIRLDFLGGKVVVADSGPGVDRDDVPRLFTLFFTKRNAGRGVGLYLAKVNLEAGRHSIWYAGDEDPHVLGGANFIIEFRGLSSG
jgi:signal transduction histidine kinase